MSDISFFLLYIEFAFSMVLGVIVESLFLNGVMSLGGRYVLCGLLIGYIFILALLLGKFSFSYGSVF